MYKSSTYKTKFHIYRYNYAYKYTALFMKRKCPICGEPIEGRIDKIFCSAYCKSANQYRNNRNKEQSLFKKIDMQLKQNRQILVKYNKAGKATVRKEILLNEGFEPKYFTHYWKNSKGDVYLFCFEYGFLAREENGKQKYVLIKWQDYMEK
jgi:predicted nucleic acid-binding Zn ribbon protein